MISEHAADTLSQKEWEEKLLVVREGGEHGCHLSWACRPFLACVGTAWHAVPSWACIVCLDLVVLLGEGQRDRWRSLGEDSASPTDSPPCCDSQVTGFGLFWPRQPLSWTLLGPGLPVALACCVSDSPGFSLPGLKGHPQTTQSHGMAPP